MSALGSKCLAGFCLSLVATTTSIDERAGVRAWLDAGRFDLAIAHLRPLQDDSAPAWVPAFLARAQVGAGDGARPDVLETARRALHRAQHEDPSGLTDAREALAEVLEDRGEVDEAEALRQQVVQDHRDGHAPPEELARALQALASVRQERGEPDTEALITEAESLHASAGVLELRARRERDAGRYESALALAEEALARRAATHPAHPALVRTYNLVGELHWFLRHFEASRAAHTQALDLARRVLGADHPLAAASVGDLGLAEFELGEVEAARKHEQDALDIVRARRGPAHPEVVGRAMNLAIIWSVDGNYGRAFELYEEVLRGLEGVHARRAERTAHVEYNLGLLLLRMGDAAAAQARLEDVLRTWESARGPHHPYLVHPLENLAVVALQAGEPARARGLLERASAIVAATEGAGSLRAARVSARLAIACQRLGQRERAARHAARARETSMKAGIDGDLSAVQALELLADYDLRRRRWRDATRTLLAVRTRLRRVFGPEHPQVALADARLASGLFAAGSPDAVAHAESAEAARRRHLRLTARYLSEAQALRFAAAGQPGQDVLLAAAARWRTPDLARRALKAVVKSRALVLDEIAARHRASNQTALAAAQEAQTELHDLRRRLAHLVWRAAQSRPSVPDAVADLERRIQAAERRLGRAVRESLADGEVEVSIDQLAAALPPASALVSFVRYGEPMQRKYMALVLRAGTAAPEAVPLGDASAIDAVVLHWRRSLTDVPGTVAGAAAVDARRWGADLRGRLWRRLEPALREANLVFVVADGTLALLNFAALPTPRGWLLESGPTFHALSSERDLLAAPRPGTDRGALLAVGGPDFDSTPSVGGTSSSRGSACHPARFSAIPHSALEADDVVTLWTAGGGRADLRVGTLATESMLRRDAPHYAALHLATHGFFVAPECGANVTVNPLLQSGLALAGANDFERGESDDGLLTASEIAGLDLGRASWVVLSSCGSGAGDIQDGEGVLGLRRAFSIAGAGTLVTSLWPVDDRATRWYMAELYSQRLGGATVPAAIRAAALALRRRLRTEGLPAEPAFWASFVASGDWR